jgi:hypothetical protein
VGSVGTDPTETEHESEHQGDPAPDQMIGRLRSWAARRPSSWYRRGALADLDLLDPSITDTEAVQVAARLLHLRARDDDPITRPMIGRAIAEHVYLDPSVPIHASDIDLVVSQLASSGYPLPPTER